MASQTMTFVIFFCIICLSTATYFFEATRDLKLTKEQVTAPKTDLWVVGTFLAAHKYFGADLRYVTGNPQPEDKVFYKQFPTPVLRKLNQEAVTNCELGVTQCVTNIREKATNSTCLRQIFGKRSKPYSPFGTYYELFSYRATASYYMCWYTMMEEEYLKFPKGTVDPTQGCLDFLSAVDEVPMSVKSKLVMLHTVIKDIRNNDLRTDPFLCARLWFCPDPCYGRNTRGNVLRKKLNSGNPCRVIKSDKQCSWKDGHNVDFQSLIRNKFNITCKCETLRPGFEWNSQFGLCVDKDECFDGVADCPSNRICKNTVGSYMCTCPRGYAVDPKTDVCERTSLMHRSSRLLKYNPDRNKPREESFVSQVMDFVGMSAASTLKFSHQCSVILVLIYGIV